MYVEKKVFAILRIKTCPDIKFEKIDIILYFLQPDKPPEIINVTKQVDCTRKPHESEELNFK